MLLSILPVQKVKAGGADKYVKNNFKETVINDKNDYIFTLQEPLIPLKKVKVISSNTKVATAKNMGWEGQVNQFRLTPKKEGTTKITITGTANGKKIKLKGTVKVVNFENPFTKLTLGGESYLSKMKNRGTRIEIKTDKSALKLQYKLKPGWKIKKSDTSYSVSSDQYMYHNVENGKIYSVPEDKRVMLTITIPCVNKNKGIEESISFGISSMF